MNGMSIIIKKELKRVFGDKKLVFSMFILPAIIMIALYGIMGFMIGKMNSDIEDNVNKVYVVNADDRMKNAITASEFDKKNDITYLNESDFRAKEQDIRDAFRCFNWTNTTIVRNVNVTNFCRSSVSGQTTWT